MNSWMHARFLPRHLPVVATVHHSVHDPALSRHKGMARRLYHRHWIAPNERRTLRRATCITAVSHYVADMARATLIDLPMQVIPNGVDTRIFHPATPPRRPGRPFRLLYVGSWSARKGVDLLGPIMRALGDGFELHYTGGPAAGADKPHLPANMHDIGHLDGDAAVAATMQSADALLFPSRSEGFGLVAAEAMACGLPVVATRHSSLPEVVQEGQSGLLCAPDDIGAFVSAVRRLAADSSLYGTLALAARQRAVERFSMAAMLDAHLGIYRRAIC
ncbi:glycosyltransferase family 4 protein [Stenotrophomonas mori]|uniref:glycosyltransferase family 4 protein n=1 Tax=Stenotrophomonas mori TaxID=2871096 RepID=UPI002020D941